MIFISKKSFDMYLLPIAFLPIINMNTGDCVIYFFIIFMTTIDIH